MIQILRAENKEFYVVTDAGNGELLSDTETVKTRLSCYKNIIAQGKNFGTTPPYKLQDNTLKNPLVQILFSDLRVEPLLNIELSPLPEKRKAPWRQKKKSK